MIIVLIIQALLGPLIFRYMMGSRTSAEDDATVGWASKMDAWEWGIITVLFLGFIGSLMRLLPFVGGRPSSLESSQKVDLDGAASLGICSPFASEDDTILLRSLLGRTCTVFHTVGSRHDIQGLYVDAILNEKRIKGENGRRALWVAWMSFLTSLVDVCYLIEEERNSGKSDEVAEKLSLKQNWAGTQFDYDPEIFPDSSIDSLDFRGRGLTIGKNNRRMTVGSMRGGPEQIRTTFSSFGEVGYAIHAGLMSSDNLTETIDKWADDRFSALSSKVTASMDHNQPRDEENNNGISLSTQSHGFGSFSRLRSTSQQFASPAQKKVQHRIFLPTIMSLSDYNFTDVSGHVDEDDDRSDLKKRASRALSPIKDSIDVGDSSQEEGRDRTNSKGKTVTINANKSYSDEVVDDSNDIVDDNPNLLKRRSYYEMKKLGMAPLNRSDSEENYGQVISTPRAWSTKKTATVEDPTVSPLTPRVDESPTASNDGGLFIDAHDLGNMLSSKDYLDSRGRGYSSMFYSSKLPGGESTREYGALRRAFSRSSSKAIPNSRSVGIASSISDDTGSLALGQNLKVFQMNTKLFSTDNDLAEGSDEDQDNSDNSGEKKTFTNFSKTRIEKDAVPEDAKFANSHGLPSLKVEMETIVPMIEFLDAWLEEMKSNEWTYDFTKPR